MWCVHLFFLVHPDFYPLSTQCSPTCITSSTKNTWTLSLANRSTSSACRTLPATLQWKRPVLGTTVVPEGRTSKYFRIAQKKLDGTNIEGLSQAEIVEMLDHPTLWNVGTRLLALDYLVNKAHTGLTTSRRGLSTTQSPSRSSLDYKPLQTA